MCDISPLWDERSQVLNQPEPTCPGCVLFLFCTASRLLQLSRWYLDLMRLTLFWSWVRELHGSVKLQLYLSRRLQLSDCISLWNRKIENTAPFNNRSLKLNHNARGKKLPWKPDYDSSSALTKTSPRFASLFTELECSGWMIGPAHLYHTQHHEMR